MSLAASLLGLLGVSALQTSRDFPGIFFGPILHGRMKGEEKVEVMGAFKAGEYQLLVATTVVEVGVDVPNATHMFIENAERLGLAQLHQLRGRVGRGHIASRCFLLFKPGVSQAGQHRLNALRHSQDGFYLAEQDLKLRGPGDILGTRQSGEQSFKGQKRKQMDTQIGRKHNAGKITDIRKEAMKANCQEKQDKKACCEARARLVP